jgi:hypothetical protein
MRFRLYFTIWALIDLCTILAQFMHFPDVANFFSFFTILSNILTTAIFFYVGLGEDKRASVWAENFFGATVVYMTVTGLGYWFLLNRSAPTPVFPAVNIIFHVIMPFVVLFGWMIYRPEHKLSEYKAFSWLIPPVIYLIYTFIRGYIINWYPYPFFNPSITKLNIIFIYLASLSITTYLVGVMIIWIGNRFHNAPK